MSVEFSKGKSFMEQLISNCLFCCLNLHFIYFSNKDDVKPLARFSNMVVDRVAVRHFWIASNENSKEFLVYKLIDVYFLVYKLGF